MAPGVVLSEGFEGGAHRDCRDSDHGGGALKLRDVVLYCGKDGSMEQERATGLDFDPRRPRIATVCLFALVVIFAATFAFEFKLAAEKFLVLISGKSSPVAAARSLPRVEVGLLVTGAVMAAALLGRWSHAKWADGLGVEAVAASARGEDRTISVRGSAIRVFATWLVTAAIASIGREAAIIEGSGAFGSVLGRKTGGRGDALAAAGIAAGFAAAYHAPIAAVLYLDEHLNVRNSKRGSLFTISGAAAGYWFSTRVLGGHPIFQARSVAKTSSIAIGALIALVPAVLGARIFLEVRVRFAHNMVTERSRAQLLISTLALAVLAGVSVAVFRDAAGNGMEALRSTAGTATIGLAVALAFGKLVGTTAALASGVPGGVLTPTLSVAAGFALLASFGLSAVGIAPVSPWTITIAAMAVGLTVGLRSPLMAIVMVPELVGDYSLIPVIAAVVAAAWLIDRQIDRFLVHVGQRLPDGIHDEDG